MADQDFSKLRLALCQLHVTEDKSSNLIQAADAISSAAADGAKLIVLPECFNSPYDTKCFPEYAEEIPSPLILPSVALTETPTSDVSDVDEKKHPSTHMLCSNAKKHSVYIIGGSIPEREGKNVYNTCVVVGPDGNIILKHRKMHLFDIDVPGKITFRESDTLTGGSDMSVFATPYGNVGVAICYDIRFPELAMLMRREHNTKLIVYPGAFNMTTGPAHWELLQRARAVDNQVYVAAASPARDMNASYNAWGHSTIVSPWGDIVATTDHQPSTVTADLDLKKVGEIREQIPISYQTRSDLYRLQWLRSGAAAAKSPAARSPIAIMAAAAIAGGIGGAAAAYFISKRA